jgi:hypothetical protein
MMTEEQATMISQEQIQAFMEHTIGALQMQKILKLSRRRIHVLCETGRIKGAVKIGREWRARLEDVKAFNAIPRKGGWRKGVQRGKPRRKAIRSRSAGASPARPDESTDAATVQPQPTA